MLRFIILAVGLLGCDAKPLDELTAPASAAEGEGEGEGEGGTDADRDGVAEGWDCDDEDPSVYPGAEETCDGLDNDCDDEVDEDVLTTWYTDGDGDGYGGDTIGSGDCETPAGAATVGGDCDDADAATSPGAEETCDGLDNDCDGEVDDTAVDGSTWYADVDGDGYGDDSTGAWTCTPDAGAVGTGGDCDDGDAAVSPDAEEVCDGIDDDCDGTIDEDTADASTWYTDADGDGYGDDATAVVSCEPPDGAVSVGGDCDDGDASASPDAEETCDGIDEDCDGEIDEDAIDAGTWYGDADADGYGDPDAAITSCEVTTGVVLDATDCDDGDASSYPGADEVCDGADNDCDGSIDDEPSDGDTFYDDADGDGYGDPDITVLACDAPAGTSGTGTDCDDGDASSYPGAEEICDSADNDCDGSVDDSAVDMASWYADADRDGYGDASDSVTACASTGGRVSNDDDCNDADAGVSPADAESCDGVDEDCDGYADDGGVCGCEVEYYGDHAYQFCTTEKKWTSARSSCNDDSYELVTIDDATENAWVFSTARTYSTSKYWWTGFNDRDREASWEWDDGSSSTYTNWASGEPNDSGRDEDCMELSRYTDGTWNDSDCDDKRYYVCESY